MQILYLYENRRGVHLLITQYVKYASEKQSRSSLAIYFSMKVTFNLNSQLQEEKS